MQKSFLEPICDDCLLDELGVYVQDASGDLSIENRQCGTTEDKKEIDTVTAEAKQPTEERGRTHVRNGSGLIWSSDVQIEITPSPTSSHKAAGLIFDDEKEVVDFSHSAPVAASKSLGNGASTAIHDAGMASTAAWTPRNSPATYSPDHVPSSIDLARRRPWLVKQYGDYLKAKGVAENQADDQSGTQTGTTCFTDGTAKYTETDNKILESTVKVEVLDNSALNDALHSDLPPLPTSPSYRFPSTHFPHAVPPRHPSTFSHTTSQSIDADADDEASLPTFSPVASPIPTLSLPIPTFTSQNPLISPNITQRKPRPRSATKALRRRGMDISRSSFALRISSRWGSAEKRCLKGFREDLLGRSGNDEGKEDASAAKIKDEEKGVVTTMTEVGKEEWEKDILRASYCTDTTSLAVKSRSAAKTDVVVTGTAVEVEETDDSVAPPPIKFHRDNLPSVEPRNAGAPTPAVESDGSRGRSRSPAKNPLTRFTHTHHGGNWSKSVKGVFGDLKRSLSKDSRTGGRRGRLRNAPEGRADTRRPHPLPGIRYASVRADRDDAVDGAVKTLRAVVDSSEALPHPLRQHGEWSEGIESDIWPNGGQQDPQAVDVVESAHRRGSAKTSGSVSTALQSPSGNWTEGLGNSDLHQVSKNESWQAHLSHDLSLPQKSKKHVLQNAGLSKSEARLPSTADLERQKKRRNSSAMTLSKNWLSRSSPILDAGEYDHPVETLEKRRLLSTSTGPSIPVTASSGSSHTWVGRDSRSPSAPDSASGHWKGERLASIVSSSEFEVDNAFPGVTWSSVMEDDKIVDPESTAGAQNEDAEVATNGIATLVEERKVADEYAQDRPRNPTPSSAPVFRFKPQPQVQLTQHPLSTPLRISTPNRPILPLRTSSLNSPPLCLPNRVGISPSFALTPVKNGNTMSCSSRSMAASNITPSRTDIGTPNSAADEVFQSKLTHSPTSDFACIWQRYLCENRCGRVAKEAVMSCICPVFGSSSGKSGTAGAANEVRDEVEKRGRLFVCRSTAPVVRYVEAGSHGRSSGVENDSGREDEGKGLCEVCSIDV